MISKAEKVEALEEAVRRLESVKAGPDSLTGMDFADAHIDGFVATALSAARAALSATMRREDSDDLR